MPIPQAQPFSKNNKALEPKKKIFKNRDGDGLHASKHKKVVSFDLDKQIVSYQPKAEASDSRGFDPNISSPMDRAREIQANLASNFPSFVKKMLTSHVAGCFRLGLPKKFTRRHLPKQDVTVVLVDESEGEHKTKYLAEKSGLSGGWRGFSVAHNLQEKDVLVFHLIQECRFKVYIVRANSLSEVDGAIDLLNLCACERKTGSDHHEEGLKMTAVAPEEHLKQYSPVHSAQEKDMVALSYNVDAAADNSGMNSDNSGSDDFHGLWIAHSVTEFKDVEDFKSFSITVDRIILDNEIPHDRRVKYYELCCIQKSYLHDQLIEKLSLHLVVGMILETVSIFDAISSSKPGSYKDLKAWDNTLKSFEILGMKVGFLRAKIDKLLTLSSDSEDALQCKIVEKAKAEEELKALEIRRSSLKEVTENLAHEIEAMKIKAQTEH